MARKNPFEGGGTAYTQRAADRHRTAREQIEMKQSLGELAASTRRPGQSTFDRLQEIMREQNLQLEAESEEQEDDA